MVLSAIVVGAKVLIGAWVAVYFLMLLGLPLAGVAFRGVNNYTTRLTAYIALGMLVWDATISRNREMELWEGGLVTAGVLGYSLYNRGVVG